MLTRELKTTRGHLMLLQQRLYNGLPHPVDYSIFARNGLGRTQRAHLQAS